MDPLKNLVHEVAPAVRGGSKAMYIISDWKRKKKKARKGLQDQGGDAT